MIRVLTDERCKTHEGFTLLTERPARLKALDVYFANKQFEIVNNNKLISKETLSQAHSLNYIEAIEKMSKPRCFGQLSDLLASTSSPYLQYYMRVMANTYNAALASASLSFNASEQIIKNQTDKIFSVNRPPGHHASGEHGEGFCIFNNAALAALHLASNGRRVVVVDFDHHHGNGTENILLSKNNSNILFVSSFWEKCKYAKKKNITNTTNNIRVPLPTGAEFNVILNSYRERALSQLAEFKADVLVFSAGFDMHYSDPLSSLKMRSNDYFDLTRILIEEVKPQKIISILEGGYEIEALVESVDQHLAAIVKA